MNEHLPPAPASGPPGPRSFGSVSEIHRLGPDRFQGEVDAGWTIGGKPNGGYLLALLGRAASTLSVHHHVTAASAHYLRSPDPGPVAIETELLRSGRSASQIRARLLQGENACVEALLTVSRLDAEARPYWDGGLPDVAFTPFEECPRLVPGLPDGRPIALMEQVEVRLDPAAAGLTTGQATGRGELRGWLVLPDGEAFDPTSLLFAADSFPPATFDIEFAGWVPTLELTVYVRGLPAPGPLRVLQRAQLIEAQKIDELCYVWDSRGRLVAQATQLAAVRLG